MGLALSSRLLADLLVNDVEGAEQLKTQIAVLNEVLAANGLPPHHEPEVDGAARPRAFCGGFPYSFLHYLRRAFARVREGQPLTPVAPGDDPLDDPVVESATDMMDSHLLCHSDAEGFYVPVDFARILVDADDRVPGGLVGSTYRLMAELVEVAPALGIALVDGRLSDADAARLAAENDEQAPYWRERLVWLALYESARVSIANKSLLVFC